jgi:hypothetical protein
MHKLYLIIVLLHQEEEDTVKVADIEVKRIKKVINQEQEDITK